MKRILAYVVIAIMVIYGLNRTSETAKTPFKIRYSTVPVTIDSLFHIAYTKDLFKEQGLDVEYTLNNDGKTSLNQLFNGSADIVTVTAVPIVYNSFKRDDFYILADIKHTNIHKGIVRKSSGIKSEKDLKGKKLAAMKGTSAEFFMDTYLAIHNIDKQDNTIIESMNAPQKVEAFVKGEIDGFFCWEPFISKAEKLLGDDALVLPNKDVFIGSWLIIAKKEFVNSHPLEVENFLRALYKAEGIIENDRKAALTMHAKLVGVDRDVASKSFSGDGYSMKLDESLLNLLEDEAQWIIDSNYTDAKKMPNYLKRIYTKSLKAVKPGAVTIVGYQ